MSKIVVAAHQPNFLPYLGFFDKMKKSDIFVIRDEVLFIKQEFHNRNKIRINGHNPKEPLSRWLKVPVEDPKDYIMHVKIRNELKYKDRTWQENILHHIKASYSKSPYFENFFPEIEKIFLEENDSLLNLNMKLISFLANAFGIKTKIIFASSLNLKPKNYEKSDASIDLVKICQALNADVYFSGSGAKAYLNEDTFEDNNIELVYQEFEHPEYEQVFPEFLPYMSALDALFCCGGWPEQKASFKLKLNPQPLSK